MTRTVFKTKTAVFNLAFTFIWITTILAFKEDRENKVLLVLSNGTQFSLKKALKDNVDHPYNRTSELSNADLSTGYFGSSRLETWRDEPPETVELLITNSFQQTFWHAVFNTKNTNSSEIENWFLTENLQSSSNPEALGFHAHSEFTDIYPVAVTSASYQRKAAFAIRHVPSTDTYAYFITSNDTSVFSLYEKRDVKYNYVKCSELAGLTGVRMDDFNVKFMHSMTVELCSEHCWDQGHRISGLHKGTDCYCVQSTPGVDAPRKSCHGPCAGNELTESCGTTNYVSIYNIISVSDLRERSLQETKNFVTFNESNLVSSLDDVKIPVDDIPRYVSSIKLEITSVNGVPADPDTGEFHLSFSYESCDENIYTMYMINDTIQEFTVNTLHELEVLKVRCLYLSEFNLRFSYAFRWEFGITELTDDYILAPFLVLKGHYPLKETASRTASVSEMATQMPVTSQIASSVQTIKSDDILGMSTDAEFLWQESAIYSSSCCFCDCSMYSAYIRWQPNNESDATWYDVESITNQLKQENIVNKTTLSAYTRTKTSAPDPRPSSKGIGCFGLVLLIAVITFVVAIDLSSMKTYIMMIKDNLKKCK